MEYDDARSGGFEPLRDVTEDKSVVLGLISTKRTRIESIDLLRRRITEASRYIPLERIGLSSQCGFASSIVGNYISPDDQSRKLALVVETAKSVWG